MDQQKHSPAATLDMVLKGIIGIATALIGTWATASYLDGRGMAANPGGGPGATLVAMFICSPASLILGPVAAHIGSRIAIRIGNHRQGKHLENTNLLGFTGAAIAGLLAGILPWVIVIVFSHITEGTRW